MGGKTESKERLTIPLVKQRLYEYMGTTKDYQPLKDKEGHELDIMAKDQAELPKRSMMDSYSTAVIPLSTDFTMRERYVTFLGTVRVGRLMEDIDIFSVWVCYQHIVNPKATKKYTPYVVVTVLVDQVDFREDFQPRMDTDILISGHVSWTGRSTLETTVWLEQKTVSSGWELLCRSVFLMAARDRRTRKAAVINALQLESDEERAIFQAGERRKARRSALQTEEMLREPPDPQEIKMLHNHWLSSVDLHNLKLTRWSPPKGSVWVRDAQLSNLIFCHPEDRNMYNTVFGGFLMRNAVELAWATAYLISKMSANLQHISYVGFKHPLAVGSLMRMHSSVIYSEGNYLQLMTYAEVFDPETGQGRTTNVFHYSYLTPRPPPMVAPLTYHEAVLYCDGRRHYLEMLSRNLQEKHTPTQQLLHRLLKQ